MRSPLVAGSWLAAVWLLVCSLALESSPRQIVAPEPRQAPSQACVPCTTDLDCAEKNPGVSGLYAFPEKAYGNEQAREMNDIEEQH